MTDNYSFWKAALAGAKPPPVIDEPQPGFYRCQRKGRIPLPLAIWLEDGIVMGRMGEIDLTRDRLNQEWMFCCAHPISEEAYRSVAEAGGHWPDMDATVNDHLAGIGDNRGPTDPAEMAKEQVANAVKGADDYNKITSDEQASKSQSLRSRLLELSRDADKQRDALNRPHLDASAAINKIWQPIVKAAKEAADRIKRAQEAWEDHKRALAREAERKAAEAARKAEEAGRPPPPPLPPTPPPAAQIGGAYGRKASVGTYQKCVIDDLSAVFSHFKDRPEVFDTLYKLAQKTIDAGIAVPGTHTEEKSRVK